VKFNKAFILVFTLALLAIPFPAQASDPTTSCTVATLNGNYGGFAEGVFLVPFPGTPSTVPYPAVAVGLHSFDGAGNWSVTYAGSAGGLLMPWGAKAVGTYNVTSDCEVTVEGTDLATGLYDRFVGIIIGEGMSLEIQLMYTVPFMVARGTLRKTPVGGCSQETFKGTYVLSGPRACKFAWIPSAASWISYRTDFCGWLGECRGQRAGAAARRRADQSRDGASAAPATVRPTSCPKASSRVWPSGSARNAQ